MKKRIIAVVVSLCILSTCFIALQYTASAATTEKHEAGALVNGITNSNDNATILQCWNWSYANLKKEMPKATPSGAVKKLRATAEASAYQKEWFQGLKARVEAGEDFGYLNADVPMEILKANLVEIKEREHLEKIEQDLCCRLWLRRSYRWLCRLWFSQGRNL